MCCTPCANNVFRLLQPGSELPDSWRPIIQLTYDNHLKARQRALEQQRKDNHTRRTKDGGALKRKDQEVQNKSRRELRATITKPKKDGDFDKLLQGAYNIPRFGRAEQLARERGFDPNYDIFARLGHLKYFKLIAAASTDGHVKAWSSEMKLVLKGEDTAAAADIMMAFRELNREFAKFTEGANGSKYDSTEPPKLTTEITFVDRRRQNSKQTAFVSNYLATDKDTIDCVSETSRQMDQLRDRVQAWYKEHEENPCGVKARRTTHSGVPYPRKEDVKEWIDAIIEDEDLCAYLKDLLDIPYPNPEDAIRIESLRNGTFYVRTRCDVAFHWCPQLIEFGFPSSKSLACKLNRDLFYSVVEKGVEQGFSRRDLLSSFLVTWAGLDGSINGNRFEIIIPDDQEMEDFFVEILTELHEGQPFYLGRSRAESPIVGGKNIRFLGVHRPYKLCSVLVNVLEDGHGVPPRKVVWARRHASTWKNQLVGSERKRKAGAIVEQP